MFGLQENSIRFVVYNGSFNALYSENHVLLNTWYYDAAVLNGTTGYININGVLVTNGILSRPDNVY